MLAAGYIFPSDLAIDGIVRIDQLGASLWEVAHDWRGLWGLAIVYFVLAVISAHVIASGGGAMASRSMIARTLIVLVVVLVAAGASGYLSLRRHQDGRRRSSASCARPRSASRPRSAASSRPSKCRKARSVRAGDVVAELSALELTASVAQARAALAAATADREHVYAGVRAEEVAALAAEIAKAKSRLDYAEAQLDRTAYLARSDVASQQTLDQAENDVASARADVAEAQANHAAALAGPTREERAIADAQVAAAAAALAVLERRLDKTILRAPADGVVSVIVAEVGENVRAGQPVLAIEATGKRWLSFNAREDTCCTA